MDWLTRTLTESKILAWDETINNWFFVGALLFLAGELIYLKFRGRLKWNIIADAITNFATLFGFFLIGFLFYAATIAGYYFFYELQLFGKIPITPWSILLCIVLADFVYYWEHRFMHRMGIGWATHTVHHSSPYFNISVAYRFGPLDGVFPFFFHLPLALLGFNPVVIFFAEILVQLYQTALHTEVIGKLPRPIEAIMNTPSHHRVHHGSNEAYLDTNYGGIFIIWDRMFGTFAREVEQVKYGITEPINSVNPFVVFFHGLWRISVQIWRRPLGVMSFLFRPPEWRPND